jgi:hypothetical protein
MKSIQCVHVVGVIQNSTINEHSTIWWSLCSSSARRTLVGWLESCPRTGMFPFYITVYQSALLFTPKSIECFGILLKWWSTREVRSTTLSQDLKTPTSVCNASSVAGTPVTRFRYRLSLRSHDQIKTVQAGYVCREQVPTFRPLHTLRTFLSTYQ